MSDPSKQSAWAPAIGVIIWAEADAAQGLSEQCVEAGAEVRIVAGAYEAAVALLAAEPSVLVIADPPRRGRSGLLAMAARRSIPVLIAETGDFAIVGLDAVLARRQAKPATVEEVATVAEPKTVSYVQSEPLSPSELLSAEEVAALLKRES